MKLNAIIYLWASLSVGTKKRYKLLYNSKEENWVATKFYYMCIYCIFTYLYKKCKKRVTIYSEKTENNNKKQKKIQK